MKDFKGKIQYKGEEFDLVFNLNVMEQIQEEYGTVDKWASLTDGKEVMLDADGDPIIEDGKIKTKPKEVDAKAIKFGIQCMLNEGIDIKNEEEGTDLKPFTMNQVGRLISDYGLEESTNILNDTVIESSKTEESEVKNV